MEINLLSILKSNIYISNNKLSSFKINKFFNIYKEDILDSSIKNALIVTNNKKEIETIILIITALKLYLEAIHSNNSGILEKLEYGQLVMYENKKYRYLGCEKIEDGFFKGKVKIVLESKNGRYKIDKEQAYKLSKYLGNSEKLNKMEGALKIKDTGKFLIAKLLGLNLEKLDGVPMPQIIVVFQSRIYMEEFMNALNIEIEGEQYEFSRVFPSRYYSDLDSYTELKGNKLYVQPIFSFTSRLDIADQLIGENEKFRNLILLGDSTYSSYVESSLDYLLEDDQLDKVILHNTYSSISMVENLIEKDINIYAFENQINNKVRKSNINIVVEYKEINLLLINIRKELIALLNKDFDIVDKSIFLINSFKLLKNFQTICMPISEYENKEKLENYIIILKNICENNSIYESEYKILTLIVTKFKNLYNILYEFNPKIEILKSIVDDKFTLVVNNDYEVNYFLNNPIITCRDVIAINNLKNYKLTDKNLVYISFYENKYINQFNLYGENTIKNIIYITEVFKYNYQARQLNMRLRYVYENNKLKNNILNKYVEFIEYDRSLLSTEDKHEEEVISNEEEKESLIKEYIEKNINDYYEIDFSNRKDELLNIELNKNTSIYQENEGYYDMKAYKKVIFTNGQYAYLSKYVKLFCSDSSENNFIKKIDALNIGDNVIFSNKKTEEALDTVFEEIISSNLFKHKYNEDYQKVQYFKKILKNYIEICDGDYELVSKELNYFNIEKTPFAIRQWTEYKIVGPRDKKIYKVIGQIIRDEILLNDWENIYNSFKIIRTFKSRFKKIFKYTVKSGIVNKIEEDEDDEIAKLILELFNNLQDYVDVVTVNQIIELSGNIDVVELNCLITENKI